MFRRKDATADEALPIAREVCAVCREHVIPFVVAHFDLIAEELRADGLHLGQGDKDVLRGTPTLGRSWQYIYKCERGWSAHSVAEAQDALNSLDYVFLGP